MITKAIVRSFKCFSENDFELRSLNVLCGVNGVGKSTLVQSLCLSIQAYNHSDENASVDLSDFYGLDLGQVMDVYNRSSQTETISFDLLGHGFSLVVEFDASIENAENSELKIKTISKSGKVFIPLTYISANRCFPGEEVAQLERAYDYRGGLVASVLGENDFKKVRPTIAFPGFDENLNLSVQLELWLKSIFHDVEVRAVSLPGERRYQIEVKKGGVLSEWVRPENMGIGIYYVLPILIYGLLADKNSVFIVDSPEAHLHPQAQSALAIFLSVLAKSGVQVVIETHSDHVINGIRLGVVNGVGCNASQLMIHNFNSCPENRHQEIQVTSSGNLSAQPEGFFDQSQKDIYAILKARKLES